MKTLNEATSFEKKNRLLSKRNFDHLIKVKLNSIVFHKNVPIKAPNLMCEIGMSFYQYWHQLMYF